MNAQLAAMVAGITKNNGFSSIPMAKIIKIGANVAIVAVFEFNSVKKIIKKTETKIKKNITHNHKNNLKSYLTIAKPEELKAFDKAIPPPTNNNIPQGILFAVFQSHALVPFPVGIKNNSNAPNKPIDVSFKFKLNKSFKVLLKIHNKAVSININPTDFSVNEDFSKIILHFFNCVF